MAKEYLAKTFKSGNSVALRLPKAIGFEDGDDVMIVPHADGRFTIFKATEGRAAFLALAGRLSSGFMSDGRGNIDQPARDWQTPRHPAAAA